MTNTIIFENMTQTSETSKTNASSHPHLNTNVARLNAVAISHHVHVFGLPIISPRDLQFANHPFYWCTCIHKLLECINKCHALILSIFLLS